MFSGLTWVIASKFLLAWLSQFWGWIVAGAGAVLAYLFSPTLRKYTIAIIALVLLFATFFVLGYNFNHSVKMVTHSCSEFRQYLVSGPATDKAISIFKRHGLCT